MNARDNTPLRAQIADRLTAGEDTAAGIAQAIGKGDTPSVVVKELNAMRTDGQVECEQRERGKKRGLVYWLAVPIEVAAGNVAPESPDDRTPAIISESVLPAGMRQGTRAAQIYRVLPAFDERPIDARAIATATGCAKALIDGALWAMVKAGHCVRHTNGVPYGYTRLPPAGSDSEGGEADVKAQSAKFPPQAPPQYDPNSAAFSASTDAEQDQQRAHLHLIGVLADIRAAVGDPEGKLMQDELVERVRAVYDLGEAHKRACLKWETAMMAAVGEDGINDVVGKIADLQHKVSMQDAELFKQAGVVVDLRAQLETLQREAMRGASLMSGQDRYTADGYLVRASKRKPRTLLDKDKARDAALRSIRAGAQRAEVFALVPIGHARRGVEWRTA
ncbi:MAG TPA: hypothetical protein PKE37_16280 [Thiomonas arsenitoxydans]|uniref:hypothetical protein n=1 Tax=Thiomonas arsenitoxydans (strain DSM 22701 / CIP 110005 / 3As) TaxID=426114 RepID=UPI002B934403|nr:hypothetical protein [Thiomonas arsenitoxydans]HML83312.1 hypothetical protein [Thiomonas arsenitoxydans]